MNNSSLTNTTGSSWRPGVDLWALWNAQTWVYSLFVIIGVPVNLWFLLAILTSAKLRVRLRNKLVSGLLVAHLLDTAVVIPLFLIVERIYRYRPDTEHNCLVRSFFWSLSTLQNFVANWTLVILVALLLSIMNKVDCSRRMSRSTQKVLRNVIPALPWVGALLFLLVDPGLGLFLHDQWYLCIYHGRSKGLKFYSAESAIPLVIAFVLVVIVAVERRCRDKTGATMSAELIGRDWSEDSVVPYAVMVGVALALDIPNMLRYESLPFESFASRVYFAFSSHVLVCAQSVVMPFVLLLLDDLRVRIKYWRPWRCADNSGELNVGYCPHNSEDFTVGFHQETP